MGIQRDLMCAEPRFLLSVLAYVGGNFNNNWTKDGFFAWNCNNASSNSNWNYGARLLIYENKKILHIIFHSPC